MLLGFSRLTISSTDRYHPFKDSMTPSLAARLALCLFVWTGSAAAQQVTDGAPVAAAATLPVVPAITLHGIPAGCTGPEYPPSSLRSGEEGAVTLGFLINVEGFVEESRIVRSSGYRALDEAARVAIARCRFKPAMVDGMPVASRVRMQYVWSLR